MKFGVDIPFVHHLGFDLVLFEGGHSQIDYEPRPEHLNSFDVTHGGACMTLLDVTMATAARSVQQDMGVVTIEMKTSFMQAAQGPLVAKGRLIHRTATMAFTEATVFDAKGRWRGSIAIAGASAELPAQPGPQQLAWLTSAAAEASRLLGWRGGRI